MILSLVANPVVDTSGTSAVADAMVADSATGVPVATRITSTSESVGRAEGTGAAGGLIWLGSAGVQPAPVDS